VTLKKLAKKKEPSHKSRFIETHFDVALKHVEARGAAKMLVESSEY
jgi:hypothetical protein